MLLFLLKRHKIKNKKRFSYPTAIFGTEFPSKVYSDLEEGSNKRRFNVVGSKTIFYRLIIISILLLKK